MRWLCSSIRVDSSTNEKGTDSVLWGGRIRVYCALWTLLTHSGVTERDLLVLKSTHLQSFQSGSLRHKKRRHVLSKHCAEKLLICCAKRSVFRQREVMKRYYARPYRACWLSGPLQAATGWLQELHSAAAACLPALFPGSLSFLGVSRGLPWKRSASYWLKISLTRSDWCKASQSRLPVHCSIPGVRGFLSRFLLQHNCCVYSTFIVKHVKDKPGLWRTFQPDFPTFSTHHSPVQGAGQFCVWGQNVGGKSRNQDFSLRETVFMPSPVTANSSNLRMDRRIIVTVVDSKFVFLVLRRLRTNLENEMKTKFIMYTGAVFKE